MKVMTVLGTRPEIIRLSLVIELLDRSCEHTLVHTGQNFDERLDGVFFRELGIRKPDYHLGVRAAGFGEQAGQILAGVERLLVANRPDRVLILGDTNSGLAAIVARRLGIPVYHMEAGNRCFDDRVPEEVNRRIIDHTSSVLMPYTERSRANLLAEGIASDRVYVTGNPINEVLLHYGEQIEASGALGELGLAPGRYFLATVHRAENVDRKDRLESIVGALSDLKREYGYPVIGSLHPRTASRAEQFGIDLKEAGLRFLPPLGFFDFVKLEKSAFCLLSDSGTVQEEACIFGVANVTLRDVTERPETLECGSNLLSGAERSRIVEAVRYVAHSQRKWVAPAEYLRTDVAETVCRIVLGYRVADAAEEEWKSGRRG